MKIRLVLLFVVCLLLAPVAAAQEKIVGIGVSLAADSAKGGFKIAQVIPGGPAEGAGVKPGLVLRKVGDVDLTGKTMTECVALVRGPAGSKVRLELIDPTDNSSKLVELARQEIVVTKPVRAKLGDKAAALEIKEWIKGNPVDVRDGRNVYVVEFWATWCPPCRVSIPHLTELQKKFKDKGVIFVGISDEAPSRVKPFVTKMAEKMDYIVACDNERRTFAPYMEAFGQNGIPTAFVVDKNGKVAWVGHPMGGLDKAVEAVLAGSTP